MTAKPDDIDSDDDLETREVLLALRVRIPAVFITPVTNDIREYLEDHDLVTEVVAWEVHSPEVLWPVDDESEPFCCPYCAGEGCQSCGFSGHMLCDECGKPITDPADVDDPEELTQTHYGCEPS